MSRSELMGIGSADPFLVLAARDRRHQHDDQECVGVEYETREEKSERQFREYTEHLLVQSAEMTDADLIQMDKDDRLYRETHTLAPSEEALAAARKYMDEALNGRKS